MSDKSDSSNQVFEEFIKEVKKVEEADSIYTSEKQINRLLRPGSSYANLNPFEVLLVEWDATLEEIRKQYKKMSILLHPDKNPNDRERSQTAFDIVTKAYRQLENETTRKAALEVVEEAKHYVNQMIEDKKRKLRKEGKKNFDVEEEQPEVYKQKVKIQTMKLFADYERKRRVIEERNMEERKRKREEEIEEENKRKEEQEWNKNYEESREIRVNSWKCFTSKAKRKQFRPPQHKPETK